MSLQMLKLYQGDASGMSLASNLNLDMRWLHPTAWVYWQVLDGGGWGLVSIETVIRQARFMI